MNILGEIVAEKKKEVDGAKSVTPVRDLLRSSHFSEECYPFAGFLKDPTRSGVIAEFKRRSPSKGWIHRKADAEIITRGYATYGASAISVLTDTQFFGGSLVDLDKARMNQIPILRKEFIIDEYQIIETKASGADVILLIAACLSKKIVKEFAHTAKNLGLNVLLELHTREELDMICDDVDVVGINNRNLKTFKVDIENSIRMAHQIPEMCKISESGIDQVETIRLLKDEGFNGFLIGERFMRERVPWKAFKEFVSNLGK